MKCEYVSPSRADAFIYTIKVLIYIHFFFQALTEKMEGLELEMEFKDKVIF